MIRSQGWVSGARSRSGFDIEDKVGFQYGEEDRVLGFRTPTLVLKSNIDLDPGLGLERDTNPNSETQSQPHSPNPNLALVPKPNPYSSTETQLCPQY